MSLQKNFNALVEEKLLKIDDLARNMDRICHDRFFNKNIYWETNPFYGPVKKNSFSLVDNILVIEEKYQEYWI